MIDKKRIYAKIDEMNSYSEEIEKIMPSNFEEYIKSIEKKRSCERLLQISIECVIDVANLIVSGLKLGMPKSEEDLFDKLQKNKVISENLAKILDEMKGFRNILVHKYGEVDDELVFENLDNLKDFELFAKEITTFLKKMK